MFFEFQVFSDFFETFESTLEAEGPTTPVRIFDSVGVVAHSCWSYFLGYWTFLVKIILFLPPNRTLFICLELKKTCIILTILMMCSAGGIHKLCSHFFEIFDPPLPICSLLYKIRLLFKVDIWQTLPLDWLHSLYWTSICLATLKKIKFFEKSYVY